MNIRISRRDTEADLFPHRDTRRSEDNFETIGHKKGHADVDIESFKPKTTGIIKRLVSPRPAESNGNSRHTYPRIEQLQCFRLGR